MAEFENEDLDEMGEELVVVMTDEEGNEYYYREEVIIPVGEKRYAILVPIDDMADSDSPCDCDSGVGLALATKQAADLCGCESSDCECYDETDVYIARIDTDENGEDIYVDPTDEEFEEARQAYEELIEEDDEAE